MVQVSEDRAVFISLLLLRSEDHESRRAPHTAAREPDGREAARCYVVERERSSRGARNYGVLPMVRGSSARATRRPGSGRRSPTSSPKSAMLSARAPLYGLGGVGGGTLPATG